MATADEGIYDELKLTLWKPWLQKDRTMVTIGKPKESWQIWQVQQKPI